MFCLAGRIYLQKRRCVSLSLRSFAVPFSVVNSSYKQKRMAFTSPDADFVIFQFPKSVMVPSTSAFCLKLETYFRIAKIVYKNQRTMSGSSKGKLPYIQHKGKQVEDSTFIMKYIKSELGVDLSANLTPAERGIAQGFKRLCEENLYWVTVYQRWLVENGAFLKNMPMGGMQRKLLPVMLSLKVKPNLRSQMHGHGIGRHTKEEIYEIGEDDIMALSDYLGEKTFFMGEDATEIDATVFGVVAQMVYACPGSPQEKFIKEKAANLIAYCDRIKEKYWPDWEDCCYRADKKPEAAPVVNGEGEEKADEPAVNGEQDKPAAEDGGAEQKAAGDAASAEPTNEQQEAVQEVEGKEEVKQDQQTDEAAVEQTAKA